MSQEQVNRKLSCILSMDVAGYSRLMEENEASTVRYLEENKRLITKLIEEHNGRVVDAPGDNMLAEFSSAVKAVDCAVKIQKELKIQNAELIENRRMQFRIGINLGDVIEENGRLYGSGVNIAARLEGLAEPGGICISRNVYDQVKTKLDLGYEYIGEHNVKNISEPVRVYRVMTGTEPFVKVIDSKTHGRMSRKRTIAAFIILIIIAAGLTGWILYSHQSQKIAPASIKQEQTPVGSDLKGTPKTIAVLPFENLSSDKDQEYFADGIAEELLNALTRISGLDVRGRISSFYFKGKDVDLQTISKKLNVDNILEGSVRKEGKKLRITVQLINTRKDTHLWSKTYERTMDDIFAIQDDIAKSVADALQITLGVGELGHMPGMTKNIAAYDAYLAGRSLGSNPGRESVSQAIEKLEQAVALDPGFAIVWYYLAEAYDVRVILIPERAEEFSIKEKAAHSRVVELIPGTDLALRITASQSGNRVEVEKLLKKALILNPENYDTNREYGWFLLNVGRPMEAIDYFKRIVRLEPLASLPQIMLGFAYDMIGNSDAAAIAFKKEIDMSTQPNLSNSNLLIFALEENNRALIDEYISLIINTELLGNINRTDTHDINQVMHAMLDTQEKARAELRVFLTDPAYINPMNRSWIAVWASYFGESELALQVFKEMFEKNFTGYFLIWRPIHKEMRRLPGFKDLVRDAGLVDYWRKSGNWGDFCHPVGEDDFECH